MGISLIIGSSRENIMYYFKFLPPLNLLNFEQLCFENVEKLKNSFFSL